MPQKLGCLNPYSNGRYSESAGTYSASTCRCCLNPYSNGRYSESADIEGLMKKSVAVLILILMEDTLRVERRIQHCERELVLILILMEDTLREIQDKL